MSDEKYNESALMKILEEFGTLNMLTVKGCCEKVFFRELSNKVFDSL